MRITVIGSGYVGLVTSACLAELGNAVTCFDVDASRIEGLCNGDVPFHEPGLPRLVAKNLQANRLTFTSQPDRAVNDGDYLIVAVNTPLGSDGSADISRVEAAADMIAAYADGPKIVVLKSTVPMGTNARINTRVAEALTARKAEVKMSVVSNPEFLKEGAAVADFQRPDRIVVGARSTGDAEAMRDLYAPLLRNHDRLLVMDPASAELTKYAANAMLATRISFMNELSRVADAVGADIEAVRRGIGSDARIGMQFLYAGAGYGGSCLSKDVNVLRGMSRQTTGSDMALLQAAEEVNDAQKRILIDRIHADLGLDLSGKHIALWGLAFKPNTDDMRGAPSLIVIEALLDAGATITAFDPVAMDAAKTILGKRNSLHYAETPLGALNDADALVIMTEWQDFRSPDFKAMAEGMRGRLIFDGRNLYTPAQLAGAGFRYQGIGRRYPDS